MHPADLLKFTFGSLRSHRLRSFLTALGIAVGIAAVILLTSIGEGIHQFVLAEFSQFGTNVISVSPGKTRTHGASVGIFGSDRPLTLADSVALKQVAHVIYSNPALQGNAEVSANARSRRVVVYGVGPEFPDTLNIRVASGRFLPHDDLENARAFAVLGSKVRDELFGDASPLGTRIEIGGSRFRVIGVMESKGQVLGFDLDDTVYIPAGRALELFNREGLMEIHVAHAPGAPVDKVVEGIRKVLLARHGREDFTITPQQQMLDVLSSVLNVLTFAVGALGGISLLVGGVGILTILTISVAERIAEIGLLRALGARRVQVLALFLGEALLLSAIGGLLGLGLGIGIAQLLHAAFDTLPVHTPWSFVVLAEMIAVGIGLAAGVAPATRAARLDPVEALRAE
ncbi:MAG TPA: ABC transporter permease [Burkholderiales bacterium]|jgi:putative ABC transport system permease protein|nr:ABC transporter permease [Burkholderiales bacterium]